MHLLHLWTKIYLSPCRYSGHNGAWRLKDGGRIGGSTTRLAADDVDGCGRAMVFFSRKTAEWNDVRVKILLDVSLIVFDRLFKTTYCDHMFCWNMEWHLEHFQVIENLLRDRILITTYRAPFPEKATDVCWYVATKHCVFIFVKYTCILIIICTSAWSYV